MADENMAGCAGNSASGGGGWWGSLWTAAKQQTEKVCEMVSHDLAEFTTTMQADTKKVVEKTKETIQANADGSGKQNASLMMKQSFHSLMSGITKALTVEPEDMSPPKSHAPQNVPGIFDRAKARLRAIQTDTGTYLHEPSGPLEQYADWLMSFDLDAHKGEISDLLVTLVEVRSLYTSLVPSDVSHQDFWRRYFYKVHQLEMDEARKQALMKRAERSETKEDSIGWDEEDDWSDSEDASPGKKTTPVMKQEDPKSRLQPKVSDTVKSKTDEKNVESSTIKAGTTTLANTPNQSVVQVKTEKQSSDTRKATDSEQKSGTTLEQSESNKIDNVLEIQSESKTILGNQPVNKNVTGNQPVEHKSITIVKSEVQTSVQESETEPSDKNVKCDNVDSESEKLSAANDTSSDTCTSARESQSDQKILQKEEKVLKDDEDTKNVAEGLTSDSKAKDVGKAKELADQKETLSTDEKNLKTKLKGDMVVVGDRISPSSESSGNKESSNEDWEHEFDIEVTPEEMAAASELAQKMNKTASDYSKLTGDDEDDWENWD